MSDEGRRLAEDKAERAQPSSGVTVFCERCQHNRVLEEDSFCGHCRAALRLLEIQPAELFLDAREAAPARCRLTNAGQFPLDVRLGADTWTRSRFTLKPLEGSSGVTLTPLYYSIFEGEDLPHPEHDWLLSLAPGIALELELRPRPDLSLSGRPGKFRVECSGLIAQGLRNSHSTILGIFCGTRPEPEVRIESPEVEIGRPNAVLRVRVVNPGPCWLTLAAAPSSNQDWVRLRTEPPSRIEAGTSADLLFEIDTRFLEPERYSVEISLEFAGLPRLVKTAELVVRLPPVAVFSPVRCDFGQVTRFGCPPRRVRLVNRGQAPLRVTGDPKLISKLQPEPHDGSAHLTAQLGLSVNEPIAANMSAAVTLELRGEGLAPGRYQYDVLIPTNDPERSTARLPVEWLLQKEEAPPDFIAIDFGTSNTCAAARTGRGRLEVVALEIGQEVAGLDAETEGPMRHEKELATAILFRRGQLPIVGNEARGQDPTTSIESVKGHLGTGMTWFLEGADRDATWVAGQFLEHVRRRISRQLNAQPSRTILTVPCVFRRPQRDALVEAFRAAGFAPLEKEVIEEPCAAAMWYLLREQKRTLDELRHRGDCHRLLVYDFGGGTLDLSLVEVLFSAKMPQTRIRVLASDGVRFGGDDLDRMLMKLLVARLRERRKGAYLENLTNTDLEVLLEPRLHLDDLRHLANRNRLRETAERMKRELSRSREAFPEDLFLEWPGGICPVPQRSEHDYLVVSRDDFYQELRPVLAEHNKVLVGSLCRSAGLSITELNLVLVTGGSSQVPLVKELLHGLLPPDLVDYPADLPAKTLVAEGALLWALHRKVLVGEAAKDLQLESLLNCQILIPTMPEMLLFERGVSLPGWKLFEWDRRQGLELRLIKREHRANGQIDTELGDILIPPQVAKEAARRTSDRLDILVRLTLDRTIEPYWIMDRKAAKGPRLPFRPTPGVSL